MRFTGTLRDREGKALEMAAPAEVVLPRFEYYSAREKAVLDNTTGFLALDSVAGTALNLGFFLATTVLSGMLWSLTNFLQLANFLPAVGLPVPLNVRLLFSLLAVANVNIEFLEAFLNTAFSASSPGLETRSATSSPALAELMPSTQLLLNSAVLLALWLLFFLVYVAVCLVHALTPAASPRKARLRTWQLGCSRSFLLLALAESTLELFLASLHNLAHPSAASLLERLSAALALVLFVLFLSLPFFLLRVLSQDPLHLENPAFTAKYGPLLEPLRRTPSPTAKGSGTGSGSGSGMGVLVLHYHSLFVARRLLVVVVLYALPGFPRAQAFLLAGLVLATIVYLSRARPLADRTQLCLEIFNEVCLLLIILLLTSLELSLRVLAFSTLVGWVCVAIVCFAILVNILSVVPCGAYATIKGWCQKCRQCRKKKDCQHSRN